MTRAEQAEQNFRQGYNCAQSVVKAFADLIDIEEDTLLRLISPFGGGMGRQREVCGAVSGMISVLGCFEGYCDPQDQIAKAELYGKVRVMCDKFRGHNGSIICRDLLSDVSGIKEGDPEVRNDEYYRKRPCAELVKQCAAILEEYLGMSFHPRILRDRGQFK